MEFWQDCMQIQSTVTGTGINMEIILKILAMEGKSLWNIQYYWRNRYGVHIEAFRNRIRRCGTGTQVGNRNVISNRRCWPLGASTIYLEVVLGIIQGLKTFFGRYWQLNWDMEPVFRHYWKWQPNWGVQQLFCREMEYLVDLHSDSKYREWYWKPIW